MASIFAKIINGDIPSYKVAETKDCYAFLDLNPLMKGHTLVVPKKEVDYLFDLGNDLYSNLFSFSKSVAHAIKAVVPCERIGVVVMGMEVPHAHIHLIPINTMEDMNFARQKLDLTRDEMTSISMKISEAYQD